MTIWTEEERAQLRAMKYAGMRAREIGAELGRTLSSIHKECHRLGLRTPEGVKVTRGPNAPLPREPARLAIARGGSLELAHSAVLRRANILHLIDLKRANYSARSTEYCITPGDGVRRFATAPMASYLGSCAASCVDG